MKTKGKTLSTHFAPAEQTAEKHIQRQYNSISQISLFGPILDSMPDIVLILNKERQIVFANQALLDVVGKKDIDSVLGLRPGEAFSCAHCSEGSGECGTTKFCRHCGAVRTILSSLQGKKDTQECRIIQTSGRALDLRVSGTPLKLDGTDYTVFTIKDISNEKRRETLERIFFHDISNIAMGLQGYLDLLKKAPPEKFDKFLEEIKLFAERLTDEITTQKYLVMAENDNLLVHVDSINTKRFLQTLVTLYSNSDIAKNRQIHIDNRTEHQVFKSDISLVTRVLGNMIKNALEASEPGETVMLGCKMKADCIQFWVHNPSFMPQDVQLQIFQRSFSTKGVGRGLGTYSMKLLSEQYLKGKVSFSSTREHGTLFEVAYPLNLG